jgi:hypothetical protein
MTALLHMKCQQWHGILRKNLKIVKKVVVSRCEPSTFQIQSSAKRQTTVCTTNGPNLERTGVGHFQGAYYVDIFMDVIPKSLELAFANPSGSVI